MKILITGGAGYIGSTLVSRLNELPEVQTIYVFDNLSRSQLAFFLGSDILQKVQFIKGDILDTYALEQVLDKVDVVYHLAAYVSSPYNYAQNVQYEQINQWGTLNVVRCIQQSKHKIKKFIYLSSASVYGLKGQVNIHEKPQPTNAYGKSKLEGEKFARLLQNYCNVKIIRAGNVFGFNNNFRMDSVLNNFIFHGLINKKVLIYGNGIQQRPFVSLGYIVNTLLNAIADIGNDTISHAIEFNAGLNELKDWLITRHIPDMEYTYINRNIEYEGQYISGYGSLEQLVPVLDKEFQNFNNNIRITAS